MEYIAYIDGSFMETEIGGVYGSGAAIMRDGEHQTTLLSKAGNDEFVSMRNVAGELFAAMMLFEHCINTLHMTQEDTLYLHYDYVGIHNWTKRNGEKDYWKAKNKLTQYYRDYVNGIVRTRFNVVFVHTPGHTGIEGNELVDRLAKQAIDNFVKEQKVSQ